jgi:hypothetical protein
MQDERYLAQPAFVHKAMRPFVEAMPEVLSPFLGLPVNLENILKTRIEFHLYCLRNNYCEVVAASWPGDKKGPSPRMMRQMLQQIILVNRIVLDNPQEMLDRTELAEDEYILRHFDLNDDAIAAYYTGQLTIGQLLLLQPMIFIRHT